MPYLRSDAGRGRTPEVGEVLADAGALDEADVVAEIVADREQRVLRVQEVVVPDDRALARHLAAADAGRLRLREKPVDAQRAVEAEVRVGAVDAVVVARVGRLPRQEDRADVRRAQHIAAAAQHGVVVAGRAAFRIGLDRHQADAVRAGASGQARAGVDRNRRAVAGQPDAAAEEQQHLFFRRREAIVAEPRFARDVAEVERAGVLEEELALLRVVEAELRQVDLLLVGFGLREVRLGGDVEGQRRRDAVFHVEPGVRAGVERRAGDRPRASRRRSTA